MVAARFRQAKHYLAGVLGLERMSTRFHVLTINYVFLMAYYTFESVFVNTLLYRITPQMIVVIEYRAIYFVFTALSMNLAAWLSKKFSPVTVIKIGGFSYIVMYLILLIGMDHVDKLRFFVGFFAGNGAGFYWAGHNVLLTHYTERTNRGVGVAILGLVQGAMTLLVPIVSGVLISLLPGNTGYRVMFAAAILTILFQRRMQNKLETVEIKKHYTQLPLALKLIWHKTTCKLMLGMEFIRGMRDGVLLFLLNMLLFEIVTQEALVGLNTFLTGLMAMVGSWAYGRVATPGRRIPCAAFATTALLLLTGLLYLRPGAFAVIVFSVLNAFLNLFIIYTVNTYSFDVMGQNETMRQVLAEMTGIRELALTAGRLSGLLVVVRFDDSIRAYIIAMAVLTAIQYIAVIFMKLTKNTFERKQIKRMSVHGH